MPPFMERNKVLDAAKYLLIILVVIGHFIEPSRDSDPVSCSLYCLIYSFHMPLFVMISGYFYKQRSLQQEILKCIPLLEICLIAHIGFYWIIKGNNLSLKDIVYFGSDPAWYLLCLIYWRMTTGLLLRFLTAKWLLALSIIGDLIFFYTGQNTGDYSLGRAIEFYPFFILGYSLKGRLETMTLRYKKAFILTGILSVIFILLTSSSLQFHLEFQRAGISDIRKFTDMETHWIFLYRYALLISALCISGLILVWITRSEKLQKLSVFGSRTLFIYYMHIFLLAGIRMHDLSLMQSLILAVITIDILTILADKPFCPYLMNPLCNLACVLKDRIKKTDL